jgi:hypothetical protein
MEQDMTDKEAMKLALEALEFAKEGKTGWTFFLPQAITALKKALAQPEQEPVAIAREWRTALRNLTFMARTSGGTAGRDSDLCAACEEAEALLCHPYTTPPQPAPLQEPCGWQFHKDGKWYNGMDTNNHRANTERAGIPVRDVYPVPQAQREWVGLDDTDIGNEYVRFEIIKGGFNRFEYAVRAIEAKLKDKNT